MQFTRRHALGLLGSTLAAPFVLRPNSATAAPRLQRVGSPILLGRDQPWGKHNVGLAAFPGGGFVASWQNATRAPQRAFIQYFANTGSPLTPPIQVAEGPPGGSASVFPIANPNGTSLILFAEARDSVGRVMDYFAQRMSAAREKIGDPYQLNTKASGPQTEVFGARLSNGNFMVAWQDSHTNADADGFDVRGRVFTFGGVPVGPEHRLNPDSAGRQNLVSMAALANEESIVSYTSGSKGVQRARVAVLSKDGARAGPPIFINRSKADDEGFALTGCVGVAGLSGSKWTGAFYEQLTEDTARVKSISIEGTGPAGRPLSLFDVRIDTWIANPPIPPHLVPVDRPASDRVLVTYYALNPAGSLTVQARIIDIGSGASLTPPVVVHASNPVVTNLHPVNESLVRLSSGIFLSGFTEQTGNWITARAMIQRLQFVP